MPYLYEISSEKFHPKVTTFNNIKARKILAFSPHSDDLSIGAGGFLVYLSKENTIQPVLAYSGFRGVTGKISPEEATKVREKEMEKETEILGIGKPIFLDLGTYLDDDQKNQDADKEKIEEIIKKENPSIIFLPNNLDLHPRHKLMTKLILEVLKKIQWKGELFFYEIPWSVFSSREYNFVVPLTTETMKKKINAIKVHKSQLKRTDFVRLSKSLLGLRAGLVPEEKIGGYGCAKIDLGKWVEVYKYEKL